jgi:hypothetical protein
MARALVILEGGDAAARLPELERTVRVVHRLPPRLAIVDAPDEALEALERSTGVRSHRAPLDAAVLASLGPEERVFAEAALAPSGAKPARPGEGLPWDAPGFEPPDDGGGDGGGRR